MLLPGGILVDANPFGCRKAGGAAVTLVGVAFHEPLDVAGVHAEFMLQDAARPDRPGLLIFRHADALAAQVRRRGDGTIPAHDDAGVKELAHGEHRNRQPAGVAA